MMKGNLSQILKHILFPVLLLSGLFLLSTNLLKFSQNIILAKHIGYAQIPALQLFTILPQIALTLSLVLASIYKPFETVFKRTLEVFIGLMAMLTLLVFFHKHLVLTGVPDSFGIYKPLVVNWPSTLSYTLLSFFNYSLFSLFIWGFINRFFSLSDGIKYYIFFAFILGLLGSIFSSKTLQFIGASKWPVEALMIVATALLVFALLTFNWSWNRSKDNLKPYENYFASTSKFPYLSAAYLLAGTAMVKNCLDILFKYQMKTQFPNPKDYQVAIGSYSIYLGYLTFAVSIIWIVLGTWLIIKKGWKTTSLWAACSILIGGVIFLSCSISWLKQGIFNSLLLGTASTLFFPLIQLLYLHLPVQHRFKTKIITEMIPLPLMNALPALAAQGLLMKFGSIAAIAIYLKILSIILMMLIILASYKAYTKSSLA